jgi:hypothetical protein
MKQIYILTLVFFIFAGKVNSQNIIDFNLTTDLTTYFNPSQEATITNGDSNGISNTGAADIANTNEVWTLKTGYPRSLDAVYKVSAYCKNNANNGRGGLGFTVNNINNLNSNSTYSHPSNNIGMSFHGGGGELVNNSSITTVSWPPDLIVGNWYFMELIVTYTGTTTFNIDFNIYNSDSNGNLGTLKTNQNFISETNSNLGGATTLYPYFCHDGFRLSQIDNFSSETENNTLGIFDFNPSSSKIAIYPNPSSHYIQISGLTKSEKYSISSILGSEIKRGAISNNEKLNIQNLDGGLYFMKFDNGKIIKFLKE